MRSRSRAALVLSTLALVSCGTGQYARPGSEPPPAAGVARLYFYRNGDIYQSPSWTSVSLNHRRIGDSAPGTVFYRDVPPGRYEIEVRSAMLYPNQFKTVALQPGSVTYVEVQEVLHWGDTSWGKQGGTTFTVSIANPAAARQQIAGLRLTPG
jgi:hypothetical protein